MHFPAGCVARAAMPSRDRTEAVKKSPVIGLGRRNRRPHHSKHRISFGGAGGSACDPRLFHSFSGSGFPKTVKPLGDANLV
jgi:hypothetical protein